MKGQSSKIKNWSVFCLADPSSVFLVKSAPLVQSALLVQIAHLVESACLEYSGVQNCPNLIYFKTFCLQFYLP